MPELPTYPVSVLVLTKDEECNIGACLGCLQFSDDVVVLDSISDDRTAEIARGFGNTRVVERSFDNWSSHQNWAVSTIDFKHPWVLYIDADERIDADFASEIMAAADPEAPEVARTTFRGPGSSMPSSIRHGLCGSSDLTRSGMRGWSILLRVWMGRLVSCRGTLFITRFPKGSFIGLRGTTATQPLKHKNSSKSSAANADPCEG